jgi:predicted DNA-binding WGR domain protein
MATRDGDDVSNDVMVQGWHLENRNGNHNKFYTVLIAENGIVVTAWGRIGQQGQSKIQKLSYADAEAIGMRQVYAKQTGGYRALTEALKFTVDGGVLSSAAATSMTTPLTRAFHEAARAPRFDTEKNAALKHYDDFVNQAQALLSGAGDRPFDEVWGEFEELEAAWKALDDKHSETRVTVDLCRRRLGQALMSGNLGTVSTDIF